MSDTVRGKPASIEYEHPRWDDGTPILIDQEVQHADEGWAGFVAGVPNSEEVNVCWYVDGGEVSDAVEFAPDDLVRVTSSDGAS